LGLKKEKKFNRIVPGTGGIDLELFKKRKIATVNSRVMIFPKAYECIVSKALPVFEALKNSWDEIQPCTVVFTAVTDETRIWLSDLPSYMRDSFIIYDRLPREKLLDLYLEARVLIAPSLLDGIPNVLYEAMATGVVPIVSPIETLINFFKDGENVIYAKNLYINDLQKAIVLAMNDDELAKKIVNNNLSLVQDMADKAFFQKEFVDFYNRIGS
jgi:glycosyltransferase involved in cell wall biosynthesis